MSVYLSYIHPEMVTAQFAHCLVNLAFSGAVDMIVPQSSGLHYAGRNKAVETFLKSDCDWLWFVDTDVSVGPWTLTAMASYYPGEPCIIAAECYRNTPAGPVSSFSEKYGAGMGCTMIHREVLTTVERYQKDKSWPWFGHDLVDGMRLGEDYTFCYRAKQLGFSVIKADDVLAQHFKLQPLVV